MMHRLSLKVFLLTDKHSYKESGQPLLLHLLDHGLFTRCCGLAHNCECIDMSDGAHGGCCEPGQTKEGADGT